MQQELLEIIQQATSRHRKLTRWAKKVKQYENGDLVSSLYLRAYDYYKNQNTIPTIEQVRHWAYLLGYQKYKEHLPIYETIYSIEELDEMGRLPLEQQQQQPEALDILFNYFKNRGIFELIQLRLNNNNNNNGKQEDTREAA